jgi:hypothetical protein
MGTKTRLHAYTVLAVPPLLDLERLSVCLSVCLSVKLPGKRGWKEGETEQMFVERKQMKRG